MAKRAATLSRLNMARIRPTLILLLFLTLIFAALRFESERLERTAQKSSQPNAAEFFLEQAITTHYTPQGKVDYQLNSDHLEYFKQTETANVTQAYFIFYNKDGQTWHSRSDTATLFSSSDDIVLAGNIRIWQPDRHLEITTQSLHLSNSRSIAETPDPIQLKSPAGVTQSVGMKLDMDQEKLQLSSQVFGHYTTTKALRTKKASGTPKATHHSNKKTGSIHAK